MADLHDWIRQRLRDSGEFAPEQETTPTLPQVDVSRIKDDRGFVDRAITNNWEPLADQAAQKYGIDPRLLKGLVRTESTGRAGAVSNKGALGLGQVMPETARGMGYNPEDLKDPAVNLDAAANYLGQMIDRANGDTELALRYYHGGFDKKRWGPVNEAYAGKVMSNAMRYNAQDESDFMRGLRGGLVGTAADWYGESARRGLRDGDLDAATQDLLDARMGQDYLQDHARTQDELSEVSGLGELSDWAMHGMGNMAGSMAPTLGYAAGGAALGSALPGVGTAIGGGLGALYGLVHQYAGNTTRGAVDQRLGNQPVTENSLRAAAGTLRPEDLDRIERAGALRGGLELASDAALGGVGRILNKGKAFDLLTEGTPLSRSLFGAASEGATEMADVPLEAYGTGGDYTTKDLLNSAAAGALGGWGMTTAGNLRGAAAQTRGFVDDRYRPQYMPYAKGEYIQGNEPLTRQQYGRQYYDSRELRDKTRTAMDAEQIRSVMDAQQQEQAAAEMQAQEAPPPPKKKSEQIQEILSELQAAYDAKVQESKPPKVTEDDLKVARAEWIDNPENEGKDIPAELADLGPYRAHIKRQHIPQQKSLGKKPTYQDALIEFKKRQKASETGPWRRRGDTQLDMYGDQYGADPSKVPATEAEAEIPEGDTSRQMEMDLPGGYTGTRLLTQSGDIYASQTPVSPVEQGDGQTDMFGSSYGEDAGKVRTAEPEAEVVSEGVDPRQQNLSFPVNDATSARQFDAAFNRADREQAKQKARDEAQAAQTTAAKNKGTMQARAEVAGNTVEAEVPPDLGMKRRQVQRLNKAQQQAEEQRRKADEAEAQAKQTFVSEANAALGGDQIQPDDKLAADGMLFSKRPPGRAPAGHQYVKIQAADGKVVGGVFRPIPQPTNEVTNEATNAVPEKVSGRKAERVSAEAGPAQPEAVDATQGQEVKAEPAPKKAKGEVEILDAEDATYDNLSDTGLDFNADGAGVDYDSTEFFSVKPGKPARGVRRSVADTAVAAFKALGQNLGITVKVFDNAQQALGPNVSVPAGTKGAYWPKSRIVGVFADAADSVQDIATTLRHEVFGHFGLNTFTPDQKRAFLDRIAQGKDVGDLKAAFDEVARDQPDLVGDDRMMAEEVFARAAEFVDDPFWDRVWDRVAAAFRQLLRGLKLAPSALTTRDLKVEARKIAAGIRKGQRQQQNFPASDAAQFRGGDFKSFVDDNLKSMEGPIDILNDGLKGFLVGVQSIPYLAKWRPDITSLKKIADNETAMQASYGRLNDAVLVAIDRIRDLPREPQKQLYRLMLDATRSRIHPDAPFQSEANAHLKEADKATYDDLRARYEQLRRASPEATKAYNEVREMFQGMRKQRIEALKTLADKVLNPKTAQSVKDHLRMSQQMTPGPYFPLVRFGSHVAVWKSDEYLEAEASKDNKALARLKEDDNHYRVGFAESQTGAQRLVDAWRGELGDKRKFDKKRPQFYATVRDDFMSQVNAGMTPLVQRMKEAVEVSLSGADQESIKAAQDAIGQVFLSALPDTNVLIGAMKRQNVAGVDPMQMMRAIAKHGGSQAYHISRLEHSGELQELLKELRAEDIRAMNRGEKISMYGSVAKGLSTMFTPDPTGGFGAKAVNVLTSVLYHSRLSLNPSFWVTSALSPAVISVPYMTDRHKLDATFSAWKTASADAAKILLPRSRRDYMRFSFSEKIKASGLKDDEVRMLQAVEEAGGLDQSQVREVLDVANNDLGMKDDAKRLLSGMAHRTEVFSRLSTALTAYRLEKKRTGDEAQAIQYAIKVVDDTLINYTHAHTPLLLRRAGPGTKAFLQFARYQVGMAQLILHNFREAWGEKVGAKPVDAKTREEARRRFWALLASHTLMSGTSGLFGLSALNFVVQSALSMAYPDDDEPDLEDKAREMMDATFGKNVSRMVRKGVPAAFGLDLSGRVGLQDMLNVRRDNPFKGDRHKMAENMARMIPSVGHAIDWLDWAKDPKAKSFPVAMVSNAFKAAGLATEGMTNTHGVVKKGPEDFSSADILFQALGFAPTEATEAYARQDAARREKEAIGSARQKLLDQMYAAMRSGDKDKIRALQEEMKAFSSRHTDDRKAQITNDTLRKSFRQRVKREQEMDEYGIAP